MLKANLPVPGKCKRDEAEPERERHRWGWRGRDWGGLKGRARALASVVVFELDRWLCVERSTRWFVVCIVLHSLH